MPRIFSVRDKLVCCPINIRIYILNAVTLKQSRLQILINLKTCWDRSRVGIKITNGSVPPRMYLYSVAVGPWDVHRFHDRLSYSLLCCVVFRSETNFFVLGCTSRLSTIRRNLEGGSFEPDEPVVSQAARLSHLKNLFRLVKQKLWPYFVCGPNSPHHSAIIGLLWQKESCQAKTLYIIDASTVCPVSKCRSTLFTTKH